MIEQQKKINDDGILKIIRNCFCYYCILFDNDKNFFVA
jgi:hypothetical protein